LDKLSDKFAAPILRSIGALEANPRPKRYKKLKGRDGHRIKSGEYRIIYEIYDRQLVVDVIALGYRKDVYR
jgi:mRNA interferase RelE/StbE